MSPGQNNPDGKLFARSELRNSNTHRTCISEHVTEPNIYINQHQHLTSKLFGQIYFIPSKNFSSFFVSFNRERSWRINEDANFCATWRVTLWAGFFLLIQHNFSVPAEKRASLSSLIYMTCFGWLVCQFSDAKFTNHLYLSAHQCTSYTTTTQLIRFTQSDLSRCHVSHIYRSFSHTHDTTDSKEIMQKK